MNKKVLTKRTIINRQIRGAAIAVSFCIVLLALVVIGCLTQQQNDPISLVLGVLLILFIAYIAIFSAVATRKCIVEDDYLICLDRVVEKYKQRTGSGSSRKTKYKICFQSAKDHCSVGNNGISVKRAEYERTEIGDLYYVFLIGSNNVRFCCAYKECDYELSTELKDKLV